MIPFILAAVGGYLIADSTKSDATKMKFADGGQAGDEFIVEVFDDVPIGILKPARSKKMIEKMAKDDEGKKNLTARIRKMADGGMMAKGGALKYYDKYDEYRLGRPNNSIEKDILEKITFSEENFVGNFGWKTPQGKLADGYLYKLHDFDQNLVKDIKLKQGEKIFRYFNRTTAISGSTPMIKINVDKELLYFTVYNENDDIVFETKGIQALWIGLIEHKMADGGVMEDGEVNWKKAVTIKIDTKKGAEKSAKLLAEYYGKSGRNFKVEKRDDKYVVTYEFNLTGG